MANVFDSDEDGGVNEVVANDEDDEEDDDYIPEKQVVVSDDADDSDPDFNAKKRKSSTSKRGRSSRSSPPEKKAKVTDTSIKKAKGRPKKSSPTKAPVPKTPGQRGRPRSISKVTHNKLSEETEKTNDVIDSKRNSLRRSSRSTRKLVSYADADFSGEEHQSEYDELEDDVLEDKKSKADEQVNKKQHVENLWSTFKDDVNKKTKNVETNETLKNNFEKIDKETDVAKHSKTNQDTKSVSIHNEKQLDKSQEANVEKLEGDVVTETNISEKKEFEPTGNSEKELKNNNENIVGTFQDEKRKTFLGSKVEEQLQKPVSIMGEGAKKTVSVTETYDFAGETVKVTKQVQATDDVSQSSSSFNSSLSNSSSSSSLSSNDSKRGGVANVLDSFTKKKKMSVLEKSKHDWESYKAEADLADEMKRNKGVGYLDKQDFLNRVDYQQWEREREMRLYTNRK